jgi:hypothetical protein
MKVVKKIPKSGQKKVTSRKKAREVLNEKKGTKCFGTEGSVSLKKEQVYCLIRGHGLFSTQLMQLFRRF